MLKVYELHRVLTRRESKLYLKLPIINLGFHKGYKIQMRDQGSIWLIKLLIQCAFLFTKIQLIIACDTKLTYPSMLHQVHVSWCSLAEGVAGDINAANEVGQFPLHLSSAVSASESLSITFNLPLIDSNGLPSQHSLASLFSLPSYNIQYRQSTSLPVNRSCNSCPSYLPRCRSSNGLRASHYSV